MVQLSINTTQNVQIKFDTASIGHRILAELIDLAIKFIYIIVVVFLIDLLDINLFKGGTFYKITIGLIIYSPVTFYSLIFESLWEGKSIGKKILNIRVIKIDGYQAQFSDYLIRWMFRIVDFTLFALIGIISRVSSSKSQRLGDMAAGTSVISLKNKVKMSDTILKEVSQEYVPTYPDVIKLSDNDVRIIKENFEQSLVNLDFETIAKIKNKIIDVTQIKNQSANDKEFIQTVILDYNYYTQNM